jgi:hypothetical protein
MNDPRAPPPITIDDYQQLIKNNEEQMNQLNDAIKQLRDENIMYQSKISNILKQRQKYYYTIRCIPDNNIYCTTCIGLFSTPEIAESFVPSNRESCDPISGKTTWTYIIEVTIVNQFDENNFRKLDKKPENLPSDN